METYYSSTYHKYKKNMLFFTIFSLSYYLSFFKFITKMTYKFNTFQLLIVYNSPYGTQTKNVPQMRKAALPPFSRSDTDIVLKN